MYLLIKVTGVPVLFADIPVVVVVGVVEEIVKIGRLVVDSRVEVGGELVEEGVVVSRVVDVGVIGRVAGPERVIGAGVETVGVVSGLVELGRVVLDMVEVEDGLPGSDDGVAVLVVK